MADEHQLPPPVEHSGERIAGRDPEGDFARFPDHEVHEHNEPGAGPYGSTGTGGTNAPIVLMAIGGLIAASVFVFRTPVVLGLGIVVFLAAAIWAGVANSRRGTMAGSGPSTIDPAETTDPDEH